LLSDFRLRFFFRYMFLLTLKLRAAPFVYHLVKLKVRSKLTILRNFKNDNV